MRSAWHGPHNDMCCHWPASIPALTIMIRSVKNKATSVSMFRFGFVEYEEKDDAAAAIDNMHNAELFGR